ncbi:hypothetical protein EV421DRAFT_2024859 [Armillaria borealis]|uniref:F-box domain-containing protein n=1 Tax=Armillaria borealis TaxID=47425 RepID=A0AA39IUQ9_9AGAR|nr:hypothetical protein EV421DRAFT_2024859 [Armillaria borealis]
MFMALDMERYEELCVHSHLGLGAGQWYSKTEKIPLQDVSGTHPSSFLKGVTQKQDSEKVEAVSASAGARRVVPHYSIVVLYAALDEPCLYFVNGQEMNKSKTVRPLSIGELNVAAPGGMTYKGSAENCESGNNPNFERVFASTTHPPALQGCITRPIGVKKSPNKRSPGKEALEGALETFMDIDVILSMFERPDPLDRLHLARLSKAFRCILMSDGSFPACNSAMRNACLGQYGFCPGLPIFVALRGALTTFWSEGVLESVALKSPVYYGSMRTYVRLAVPNMSAIPHTIKIKFRGAF